MSGLILVCSRDPRSAAVSKTDVERIARRLAPDNLTPNPPRTFESDGLVVTVTNPQPSVLQKDDCVCLGRFFEPPGRWHTPGTPPPDGSYAVCRSDPRFVELVTDAVASRTLWYSLTERFFLASTSQRAVVALLGDFDLNAEAVSWMVTAGHLGPWLSWDRRMKRTPSSSRVVLDREKWHLEVRTDEMAILPDTGDEAGHIGRLRDAILDSCANLDVPLSNWLLPLSGGMDSRSILLGLVKAGKRPRCVTWGLRSSLDDPANDAVVARRVAESVGVEHTYYETDFSTEPVRDVLGRFLAVSEGQTVDFGGYTDGLAVWKTFFDSGVEGVIRGDGASLGYYSDYVSERQIRLRGRQLYVSDYPPAHAVHRLGLHPQSRPEALKLRPGESPLAYSGRLYEQFGFPSWLSSLNDIKSAYVEVVNPLLSRRVVSVAHSLPAPLREHRKSLEAVLESIGPRIPFAKHGALAPASQYLNTPEFRVELRRGLSAPAAEAVFSEGALTVLRSLLETPARPTSRPSVRRRVKAKLPKSWAERLKPIPTVRLSDPDLVFRAYIAVGMAEMLTEDAGALRASVPAL
jgi:asparagine synthetase B (glutamine-hydrolysing)